VGAKTDCIGVFDQRCPHCRARLGWKKLVFLAPSYPTRCPTCQRWVVNSWTGQLMGVLSFFIGLAGFLLLAGRLLKGVMLFAAYVPFTPIMAVVAFAGWARPKSFYSDGGTAKRPRQR